MNSKVTQVHPGGIFTRDQQQALEAMATALEQAILKAKDAGVPQGLIVAVLHGNAQFETTKMIQA